VLQFQQEKMEKMEEPKGFLENGLTILGILRCENKTILGFSFYVMFYYVTSREKAFRINLTENTL
jgi:hypothetical protein